LPGVPIGRPSGARTGAGREFVGFSDQTGIKNEAVSKPYILLVAGGEVARDFPVAWLSGGTGFQAPPLRREAPQAPLSKPERLPKPASKQLRSSKACT
jgi:hypothetical protein